jgi:hypothetical protein
MKISDISKAQYELLNEKEMYHLDEGMVLNPEEVEKLLRFSHVAIIEGVIEIIKQKSQYDKDYEANILLEQDLLTYLKEELEKIKK